MNESEYIKEDHALLIRIDERTKGMAESLSQKVSKDEFRPFKEGFVHKEEYIALASRVDKLFDDFEKNQKRIVTMGIILIFTTVGTGMINIWLKLT